MMYRQEDLDDDNNPDEQSRKTAATTATTSKTTKEGSAITTTNAGVTKNAVVTVTTTGDANTIAGAASVDNIAVMNTDNTKTVTTEDESLRSITTTKRSPSHTHFAAAAAAAAGSIRQHEEEQRGDTTLAADVGASVTFPIKKRIKTIQEEQQQRSISVATASSANNTSSSFPKRMTGKNADTKTNAPATTSAATSIAARQAHLAVASTTQQQQRPSTIGQQMQQRTGHNEHPPSSVALPLELQLQQLIRQQQRPPTSDSMSASLTLENQLQLQLLGQQQLGHNFGSGTSSLLSLPAQLQLLLQQQQLPVQQRQGQWSLHDNINLDHHQRILLLHHRLQLQQQQQEQRDRLDQEQQYLMLQELVQRQAHSGNSIGTDNDASQQQLLLHRLQLVNQTANQSTLQPPQLSLPSRIDAINDIRLIPNVQNIDRLSMNTPITDGTFHQLVRLQQEQQLLSQPLFRAQATNSASLGRNNIEELRQLVLTANHRLEQGNTNPSGFGSSDGSMTLDFPLQQSRNVAGIGRQSGQRDMVFNIPASVPLQLPVSLAKTDDRNKLSPHQVLLRMQIEVFQASEHDVSTHTRGRNKPIVRNQVGIRCRHCSHLPVSERKKGSTYYPATVLGIYQAAQNMSTTHIQSNVCNDMPMHIKNEFEQLQNMKITSSGAGRPYWVESAKQLGLLDTDNGIEFIRTLTPGVRILDDNDNRKTDES